MAGLITQGEQNLFLLRSLTPHSEGLYMWCYRGNGELLGCSCKGEIREILHHAFCALGGFDQMLAYTAPEGAQKLRFLGSSIGMQWAFAMETERKNSLVFVIGPVFHAAPDPENLKAALHRDNRFGRDTAWIDPFCALIPLLPVMSFPIFERYVSLVHHTLSGTEEAGNTSSAESEQNAGLSAPEGISERNRLSVYQSEKALLEMVRRGDINYYKALDRSSSLSPGVPIHSKDPLRQMKTTITVFTTLVSRAAMEGGLSPEVAYPLGDTYIQTAEDCRDSGELSSLANAMYHDYIYRVHQLHANPNYSHAIQKCCDYIELSLDRKIQAKDLAALVGYTEYYLTEKFKNETGQSVSDYVRRAKINRAKVLLQTTDLSVSQIAERLAFNTPNYFIHVFREMAGCTPALWREQRRAEKRS